MKKQLGVNIESVMTSYSYYAFPQCIMTAEERVGSRIAEFSVLDTVHDEWKRVGNISYNESKRIWTVTSEDKYRRECNGCIYREMQEDDYISIQVHFQQYTEPWGAVNLFISDDEENILLGDNEYLCRFGHFIYDGTSLYMNGQWQSISKKRLKAPYQLVLHRQGNRLEIYAGEDRANCLAVKEIQPSYDKELYIGVQVRHEENSYYPWLFSNFIQLSCDVTVQHRRLEFFYGMSKQWEYNTFHYFFDTNQYKTSEIIEMGGLKYIRKCIDKGKYLETKLDQYYIPQRDEYHMLHHLHQNLIYGYDDAERCFEIVGYDRNGKLMKTQINYSDFKASIKRNEDTSFYVITYAQSGYHFRFHADYVKGMIEEYLNGVDSGKKLSHLVSLPQRTYGIKIYDDLASEQGIEVLISDRRVAHVLWEHKVCMVERIGYLTVLGILEPAIGEDIQSQMKTIQERVYDMKNILLKYQRCSDKKNLDLIKEYLQTIKDMEIKCLNRLLEFLRMVIREGVE